ncbi:MAG: universal stress protein [Bacillota bacterium]|nr:universal stress protein [Bacillota bacterium]MDP4159049.1 universal stress protein [Bacillota bacterium]
MKDSTFNVLLYSDGSHQAFSAAVYAADLLKNMPNMHLTIVQVQESDVVSPNDKYRWIDTWPVHPTAGWMEQIINETDTDNKKQYLEILSKTNKVFTDRAKSVGHHIIYSNPSISDTVDALIDYATVNSFKLIIMGTRGLTTLKGLIFGCLAHNVLNRSPIPVLLVKKLPQEFIDTYCLENK